MVPRTHDSWFPCAVRLGVALLCIIAVAWVPATAQDVPKPPKKVVRKFTPESEAKFAELLKKLREEKTKDETEQIRKELAKVVEVTGLDEAKRKEMEGSIAAAVEAAVKSWLEKLEVSYRANWNVDLDPEFFDRMLGQASLMVKNSYGTDYESATGQPAWKETLAKVLDARQAAAWKADLEEKDRKFNEEIKGALAASKERAREQVLSSITELASTMGLILSLDEERTKKLQKSGESAADKSAESVTERTRKLLRSYDEARRAQIIKTNNLYILPDEEESPEKQEVWKDGLKQILTPAEIEKWDKTIAARRVRRVRAMARVLIWAFDQATALTAKQREQLEPMATDLVRDQTTLFPEFRLNSYSSISMQAFYQAGIQAEEEDLKKVLDAKQVEHWRSACVQRRSTVARTVTGASAAQTGKPVPFEPEELEAAISAYLYQIGMREQDRAISDALLRAEDAIRVASVEGRAVERIQTAARGAAEQDFETWKSSTSSSIRTQMQNATPADFQRLTANAGYYSSSRRRRVGTDDARKTILDNALATELSEPQRVAWQKEVDARRDYECQTIAGAVISELDRMCILTDEQWSKLEPILADRMKEYNQDFSMMFSSQDAWFLQSYYMLTPVAGIPEKEMRTILNDAQWKVWSTSNQYSNGARYWENIESNHKSRARPRITQ